MLEQINHNDQVEKKQTGPQNPEDLKKQKDLVKNSANDFEDLLELESESNTTHSLSNFLSSIKTILENNLKSGSSPDMWDLDGTQKVRYLLHTIRPKILKNGDYYLSELQHDLREMSLDEDVKNKIYDSLNIPQNLRVGYHEVVIVKMNDEEKDRFKEVRERYQ